MTITELIGALLDVLAEHGDSDVCLSPASDTRSLDVRDVHGDGLVTHIRNWGPEA